MRRPAESPGALKRAWLLSQVTGRVSTRLAGWATSRLWFTPWRVDPGERGRDRREAWLEGTEPVTIEAAGYALRGFARGDGPTVLLVHGWGDDASSMGALIEPLVASGNRVVAFDLPGHGASSGGRVQAAIFAQALVEIGDRLGPLRAVVAHSMGAFAVTLALHDGLQARSAVLIAPAARLTMALDQFAKMTRLPDKAMTGLRRDIEKRFGRTVWTDFATDRLAAGLSIPALIVHDEDDEQVPCTEGTSVAEAWPGARLMTTRGLGHAKILRDPAVLGAVRRFVEDPASAEPIRRRSDLTA